MVPVHSPTFFYNNVYPSSAPCVIHASGIYLTLNTGQKVIDSTCGAAVSAIGHGNHRVKEAIIAQLDRVEYAHPGYFQNVPALELADLLVKTTNGKMARACLVGSGSEAMEAAMKLARQYFLQISPKSPRVNFIAREGSWHGCTLGALSLGDFKSRKVVYEELLNKNVTRVSACHPYRGLLKGENEAQYVVRLQAELDDEFKRVGPETVCAFVVEPMVGTALGCVPAVRGYFRAMKKVCDRYGALVIFDEVMCGLGRTGTYHAWEQEGVVPDIQAVGKGLGAGFSTISAILFNERIVSGLKQGSGNFEHGQTYQCHPVSCAAALEVQRIIQEKNLVENAREMGVYLGQLLKERFEGNVNIGDVRGRGMFWCVEIVTAKVSKLPFDPALNVAKRMRMRGLEPGFDVCLFSAQGSVDGWSGDHFLLAPPFIAQPSDIEEIVSRTARAVESVLAELKQPNGYFNGVN